MSCLPDWPLDSWELRSCPNSSSRKRWYLLAGDEGLMASSDALLLPSYERNKTILKSSQYKAPLYFAVLVRIWINAESNRWT